MSLLTRPEDSQGRWLEQLTCPVSDMTMKHVGTGLCHHPKEFTMVEKPRH